MRHEIRSKIKADPAIAQICFACGTNFVRLSGDVILHRFPIKDMIGLQSEEGSCGDYRQPRTQQDQAVSSALPKASIRLHKLVSPPAKVPNVKASRRKHPVA